MPTRKYTVTGKVQGVGFRRFAVEQGRALGLRVKAENHGDGSMSATAEGHPAYFDAFREKMKTGPEGATVEGMTEDQGKVDLARRSALVIDNGSFVEVAQMLAKSMARVYYWCAWKTAFPTRNSLLVGTGIPGVERVIDFWDVLDKVDIVVAPDIYYGGLCTHLENLGHKVWGSRGAEEYETDRVASKERMKALGIPIGKYRVLKGTTKLRNFLDTHGDVYVKTSLARGDFESFHAENLKLVDPKIKEIEYHLGPAAELEEFVVEDSIPDALEIALDSYVIDGQWPSRSLLGVETKDCAYVGVMLEREQWPRQITLVNDAVAPDLKASHYRNWFCAEERVTKDGTGYVNDPACRLTAPVGGAMMSFYKNMAEIVYEGANGVLVDPEPAGKYCCSLVITSDHAEDGWQPVHFPSKIAPYVTLKNAVYLDKTWYVVPQKPVGLCEIGEVVGWGETLEEARETVKERAKQISGYRVKLSTDALDSAEESIEKLKGLGVKGL